MSEPTKIILRAGESITVAWPDGETQVVVPRGVPKRAEPEEWWRDPDARLAAPPPGHAYFSEWHGDDESDRPPDISKAPGRVTALLRGGWVEVTFEGPGFRFVFHERPDALVRFMAPAERIVTPESGRRVQRPQTDRRSKFPGCVCRYCVQPVAREPAPCPEPSPEPPSVETWRKAFPGEFLEIPKPSPRLTIVACPCTDPENTVNPDPDCRICRGLGIARPNRPSLT